MMSWEPKHYPAAYRGGVAFRNGARPPEEMPQDPSAKTPDPTPAGQADMLNPDVNPDLNRDVHRDARGGRADVARDPRDPRERQSDVSHCPETRQALDCCDPWDIDRIDITCDSGEFSRFGVWAFDAGPGIWPCPVCGQPVAGVGYTSAYHVFRCRTCDQETRVYVRIPLADCPRDGRQEVAVPWRDNTAKWEHEGTITRNDSSWV